MIVLLVLLAVAVFSAACVSVYTPPLSVSADPNVPERLRLASLDRWLQSLHDKQRFNGTVLIGTADRILFSKSYGFADLESARPLDEHSAFNLASVSKHFTAAAILLLEQDGLLSVDDRVADHLPELDFYPSVTIEHLLHHTSGVSDYMRLAIKHKADRELFTTAALIELFRSEKPALDFEPGARFRYSNTGYVLLAEIVARVAGQRFESYMQSRIFEPLGMKDSRVFYQLSETEPENRVIGFRRNRFFRRLFLRSRVERNDLNHFDGVVGDGGIYSSARDLHVWHGALLKGSLLPLSVYQRAYVPGRLADGSETSYGYGWFLKPGKRVEHAGGWLGFSSYFYRELNTGRTIIVLDNSTNAIRVGSAGFRFNSIGLNLQEFLKHLPSTVGH